MKIVKIFNWVDRGMKSGWDALIDDTYLERKEQQDKQPLSEMQFYAILISKAGEIPDVSSLLSTSEKIVYVTKDCSRGLNTASRQWNCIVEVALGDRVMIL